MNEERPLFGQNKNPSVFAKPSSHNDGYDHQTDNKYGRNEYDHTDRKYGRYEYGHQTDNQYGANGYNYAHIQYGRCGYDHQADY